MSEINQNIYQIGILTVSDRASREQEIDKSGPEIINIIKNQFSLFLTPNDKLVTTYKIVPDEISSIQTLITQWCHLRYKLIITTGGTGFTSRDVTPEAIKPLLHKRAKGIDIAMITSSLEVTPHAMLSRPCSGIRDQTLIITLPGSLKAVRENLICALPALPHAISLISQVQPNDQAHIFGNKQNLSSSNSNISNSNINISNASNANNTSQSNQSQPHSHSPHTHTHSHSHSHTHTHTCGGHGKNKENESKYEMKPVEDALSIILNECAKEESIETVDSMNAFGRILSKDIISDIDFPHFRASIKDGYAVRSKDGEGRYKVLGNVFTENKPQPSSQTNEPKHCVKITTGYPVPDEYDAVVQVEDVKNLPDNYIDVLVTVKPGTDIRPIGSDIAKGTKILTKGDKISSSEIGLLATLGISTIPCFKLPRITILSTGNELIQAFSNDKSNNNQGNYIRDTNSPTLLTLLKDVSNQFGKCYNESDNQVEMKIIPDNIDKLEDAIKSASEFSDVIITSGGVSMGDLDLTKPLMEKIGKVHFGRVNMKPGKPFTFSTIQGKDHKKTLVFSLPGNPVSTVVCFYLFVLPALKKLSGFKNINLPMVEAKLSERVYLDPERPEYHRSYLEWNFKDNCYNASSTGSQASCRMLSLKQSNSLLIMPAATSSTQNYIEKGSLVKCLITSNIYS